MQQCLTDATLKQFDQKFKMLQNNNEKQNQKLDQKLDDMNNYQNQSLDEQNQVFDAL